MANDPNRKTLRHFYCRDLLWQTFERMSDTLDRGVDDLVNEAMKAFAQEQGFLATEPTGQVPGLGGSPPRGSGIVLPPPPALGRSTLHFAGRRPPPLPPPPPPPPAPLSPGVDSADASAPTLFLIFGNQKYVIDKDQFIIGRGVKSSDLPIRDGNISRKHAAVIRRGSAYYIKDLGSTNGIDFNGERIEGKKIEEGDVFSICEYQLKFTFK